MKLKVYNTKTRQEETIQRPKEGKKLTLYTCGPTVYHYAHIGNLRTYVFEDLFRRLLEFFKLPVLHVMNLTDVDDKTIRGALENHLSLEAFTQIYKDHFFKDLKALNILPAHFYPCATSYIPKMIKMIEILLQKKLAYQGKGGSIYFRIQKIPSYGKLSHLKLEDLKVGASERMTSDEYEKEEACDFVLWKHYDPNRDGAIFWESPFGKGRPGWHIECSAMANELLGETLDIHMGGVDNIFPHHENEIAQSEGCSGKTFVKHWIHCEHLIVDGKKMSKSLNNFYTLRDLEQKGYRGREVRFLLLATHYRSKLNFNFKGLLSSRHALERIDDFVYRLSSGIKQDRGGEKVTPLIEKGRQDFQKGLQEDLNISIALAVLFDFIRLVHRKIDHHKIDLKGAQEVLSFLREMDTVLGVIFFDASSSQLEKLPQEIEKAFEEREKARKEKNWALADEKRKWIESKGYLIEDSPTSSRIKKKESFNKTFFSL